MTFGARGRGVQGRLSGVSGATGSVGSRRSSGPACCFRQTDNMLTLCCSCRQDGKHHHFISASRSSMKAPSRCPLFPASPGGSHWWGLASVRRCCDCPSLGPRQRAQMQLPARSALQLGPGSVQGVLLLGQNHGGSRHPELSPRTSWFGASLGVIHN